MSKRKWLRKQIGYHIQTQIFHRCWNYQIGDWINYDKYVMKSSGKSRQRAKTGQVSRETEALKKKEMLKTKTL